MTAEVTGEKKRRVVLTGAGGMLGSMVQRVAPKEYDLTPFGHPELDIAKYDMVTAVLDEHRPDIIINCAAYTDVDGCESNRDLAERINGAGPGHLGAWARDNGATLVHISTDYVFNGEKREPYTEDDPTNPLSAYGMSKLKGEEAVKASGLESYFIVRTGWLYGPGGKNFADTIAGMARMKEELRVVSDQAGTPTFTGSLSQAIFNLLHAEARNNGPKEIHGIYHFSNEGECSWHGFAEEIVTVLREQGKPVRAERVIPVTTEEFPRPAARPRYSVLSRVKYKKATGAFIPGWKQILAEYLKNRKEL